MIGRVDMEGIRDVQKALRAVDKDLPKQLRAAGNTAAQIVVDAARSRASTRLERRAGRSLKVSSQQRSVAVSLGGRGFPEAFGAEFGADDFRLRTRRSGRYIGYRQFKPWRGSGAGAGYFFYPAIRAKQPEVLRVYLQEVDWLVAAAGLG